MNLGKTYIRYLIHPLDKMRARRGEKMARYHMYTWCVYLEFRVFYEADDRSTLRIATMSGRTPCATLADQSPSRCGFKSTLQGVFISSVVVFCVAVKQYACLAALVLFHLWAGHVHDSAARRLRLGQGDGNAQSAVEIGLNRISGSSRPD